MQIYICNQPWTKSVFNRITHEFKVRFSKKKKKKH